MSRTGLSFPRPKTPPGESSGPPIEEEVQVRLLCMFLLPDVKRSPGHSIGLWQSFRNLIEGIQNYSKIKEENFDTVTGQVYLRDAFLFAHADLISLGNLPEC